MLIRFYHTTTLVVSVLLLMTISSSSNNHASFFATIQAAEVQDPTLKSIDGLCAAGDEESCVKASSAAFDTSAADVDAIRDPPPMILDTDHGTFIDDIFAVGLLVQSTDVLDPKLILTTSERPNLSAKCVSKQVTQSELDFDIPIAIGETLPPHSERGGVCAMQAPHRIIGFALEDKCKDFEPKTPFIDNGVEYMAKMIIESNRKDWVYVAIGGQTSLAKLVREYPDAAASIKNLVIMGGSFCSGFDPYPNVPSPTGETNIGCDIKAANFVLDSNNIKFRNVYYVPVVSAAALLGDEYKLITEAAASGNSQSAKAIVDFYKAWSSAARDDKGLLVHDEAMMYNPETASTPQFDAVAVLVAMDVVRGNADARIAMKEIKNGVHFITNDEVGVAEFTGQPEAAYTLLTNNALIRGHDNISHECKEVSKFHFNPNKVKEDPIAIKAALGFVSNVAKREFFLEMALRMSGTYTTDKE